MADIKLKVGDRVRLYRKDKTSYWEVGHIGIVTEYWNKGMVDVKDSQGRSQFLWAHCLAHA